MSYNHQDSCFEKTITLPNLSFRDNQILFNLKRQISLKNEPKKVYSYLMKDINDKNRNFQFYLFDIHVRGKIVNEYNELIKVNITYNKQLADKQLQKLAKYIEAFMLNLDPLRDSDFDSKESFYEYRKEHNDNYCSYNDYQNQSSSYQSSDYSQNEHINNGDDYDDDYDDHYDDYRY
jgi:hypothetical protein